MSSSDRQGLYKSIGRGRNTVAPLFLVLDAFGFPAASGTEGALRGEKGVSMSTATSAQPRVSGGSFLLASPSEVFTPEDFSEQHQLIAQTAEEFAQNEIIPNIEK